MHLSARSLLTRRALLAGTVLTLGIAGATGGAVMLTRTPAQPPSPGATAAPSPSPSPPAKPAKHKHRAGSPVLTHVIAVTASTIGKTPADVTTALGTGQTLDQVAGGQAPAVHQQVLADLKTQLDKTVATGKLTAAQESTALAKGPSLLDKMMSANLSKQLQHHRAGKAATGGSSGHTQPSPPTATPSSVQ